MAAYTFLERKYSFLGPAKNIFITSDLILGVITEIMEGLGVLGVPLHKVGCIEVSE